jgi:hypothetical protein
MYMMMQASFFGNMRKAAPENCQLIASDGRTRQCETRRTIITRISTYPITLHFPSLAKIARRNHSLNSPPFIHMFHRHDFVGSAFIGSKRNGTSSSVGSQAS